MKHNLLPIICSGLILLLGACTSGTLTTASVSYQSFRLNSGIVESIPADAHIIAYYKIADGNLSVEIQNPTDKPLTIDLTRSYIRENDKTQYYRTADKVSSYTPAIHQVEAYGKYTMPTNMAIAGWANEDFNKAPVNLIDMKTTDSPCKIMVNIAYKSNSGTLSNLQSLIYINSRICVPVATYGNVNEALRKIYQAKPDAVNEYMWNMYFDCSPLTGYNLLTQGQLYDYR